VFQVENLPQGRKQGGKKAAKAGAGQQQKKAAHATDVIALLDVMAWMQKGISTCAALPEQKEWRNQ